MLVELVNGRPLWYKQDATAEDVMEKLEKMFVFDAEENRGETGEEDGSEVAREGEEITRDAVRKEAEPPETKLLRTSEACWQYMTEEIIQQDKFWSVSNDLQDVIRCCLQLDPVKRKDAEQLLEHPYFASLYEEHKKSFRWVVKPFLQCSLLPDPGSEACDLCEGSDTCESLCDSDFASESDGNKLGAPSTPLHPGHVRRRSPMPGTPASSGSKATHSLAEIYHFWKLNGGDPARHLAPELRVSPAILRFPTVVRLADFPPTK